MNRLLIENGTVVNEGVSFEGYVMTDGERIDRVGRGAFEGDRSGFTRVIDAKGGYILPGVIDDQVHFREPGLTYKAEIATESRAAAAGGVTSYMEMPNTNPPTTTLEALEAKFERAAECSAVNYAFYFGASNGNGHLLPKLDIHRVCGVKVFMGSSTGNMLVDKDQALADIFANSPVIVAAHCEDEKLIRANTERFRQEYGDGVTPAMHPLIRSAEACYRSSAHAVELAVRYSTRLHILHLSTARELTLFENRPLAEKRITNEVCVHHLWFDDGDYALKGNFIKWNPAVKTAQDRKALRAGIASDLVDVVATDHAPHTLEEKMRPVYFDVPSGGPLVQHSLVSMLQMAGSGLFSVEDVVRKMCHAPADLFEIDRRGYLRSGYYADIVVVERNEPWTVERGNILAKCGWSPFEGYTYRNRVRQTVVNGSVVYDEGVIDDTFRGKALRFRVKR